ncbi:uncharacterized protein K460DRAFT_337025 [Cucurbitaria berberidis CBS 394.84]|uniref:Uncharacterized protein n=1 Tax=Cucurbitaria berberidis CBS 394.84 TaxID=1168544 RepID=A0A9P4GFK1_9PLEO|nr:uncharacterized protein K460DRAFT_337025 [Cucurbitaria berberidis CBS 394.84]KAF1845143.1 hypothetical protein K460DRAFT_337025 [Cucurbitaria berberidis CBS 394.84]
MATTLAGGLLLSHVALCPPPLLIQKKPRRATFRRRILRKSTHSQNNSQYVFGPLDDIIDEIKGDIWGSPLDHSSHSSINDWASFLNVPSTWAVTPLPVSRLPSDQPLTIRKNRNSLSSASDSSTGDQMAFSRNNSQEEPMTGGAVGPPYTTSTTPWPLLDTVTSYEPIHSSSPPESTVGSRHTTAQQALENVVHNANVRPEATRRRSSRLRLFTTGLSRLRRTGTGETSGSAGDTSDTSSPTTTVVLATHAEAEMELDTKDPSEEAVEAYMRKHARNGTKFGSVMKLITKQLPSPTEDHDNSDEHVLAKASKIPTTLRAAVRIFPEIKVLTEDLQEYSVAVDVEGVLHNRKPLPDTTIDVIFVVDNGADSEETFRDLTTGIAVCGTQVWEPPRPNPSMAEVIIGVARSLEDQDLKIGRTHVILLSPATYILHGVSTYFPDLYIHRVNPAALPYRRDPEVLDTICTDNCCMNVFISNWASYQSLPGRIKRIMKNARAEKPVGELTNVSIDIRTRHGCKIIESCGSQDIPVLRLGQVHTFVMRIRVTRTETQGVDLESGNPVFNSSLDIKGLRQTLQNSIAIGAIKVHLFDVQAFHRNSLHAEDCWNYTETPLLAIREMGGLAPPLDTAMEVYKRKYFHRFSRLKTNEAKIELETLLTNLAGTNDEAKRFIERLAKEIDCHQAIQEYKHNYRQKLPLCPGPITVEASHEWLVDLWNKKKSKRKGVAVVQEEDINNLNDGINGM